MSEAKKPATDESSGVFTAEEKAAMKERANEVKAEKKRGKGKESDEQAVLAKIAELTEPDRSLAARLHEIILEAAPDLAPKTWYGMPGYAKDGKVLVFFQGADKFKTRYATLGFNDSAKLDDGSMWPNAYALTELTAADEATIAELVKKAVR
ncbi:DUF1801 domain-containing protein [Conyzicola nivalis]|uniref:YdhG-like domain-containing protein n=1 Tax=Conyzicola nivalis TaxID=1477021 RepID=A0A916S8Z7_9MICO|nr:DUF1801 domain-containing protein [Conyzicola nivalis]GGA89520.1 hypothetical protein GCM10010979_00310 [Conyzicola nivalis]